MKKCVSLILSILMMSSFFLTGCSTNDNSKSSTNSNGKNSTAPASSASNASSSSKATSSKSDRKLGKVLIVYFSFTGNTAKLANSIKEKTGGDIFEIQSEFDYSKITDRTEIEETGKKQVEEGYKPKLKNSVSNIDSYDYVFVGSPIWWAAAAPPVASFLSEYKLTGKKVVPFCTCGTSQGDYFQQVKKAIPSATLLKGITVTEAEFSNKEKLNTKVETWLDEVGANTLAK